MTSEKAMNVCCVESVNTRAAIARRKLPASIVENEELNAAISLALPKNYEFEIHKTLWRIEQDQAQHVGLQFPEGLLLFASQIAGILQHFASRPIKVIILGDVTYGACCIDDLTARSVGVDFLVHYGHSCLIPVTDLSFSNCLYVFVEILFDYRPLVDLFKRNAVLAQLTSCKKASSSSNTLLHVADAESVQCSASHENPVPTETMKPFTLALMGTIQYSLVVHSAKEAICERFPHVNVIVPQELPLTAGEVLGCTSPQLPDSVDVVIFVADGRFHLESAMIRNPTIPFFRYDPFTKKLFRERYDHQALHKNRREAIEKAQCAASVGLILGTLGRQGSVGIFERLRALLKKKGIRVTLLLMSEIAVDRLEKLARCGGIDAFVQISCPRLSLDWGHCMGHVPLLTPYEAFVAFGDQPYFEVYPMDYYARNGGPWTNFNQEHRSGSLAKTSPTSTDELFSDLRARRTLIRQRAEARRAARASAAVSGSLPEN